MRVAIYGKVFKENFHDAIYKIFEKLNKLSAEIIVYKQFYNFISDTLFFNPRVTGFFETADELENATDIIFSIGGDGTFLECVGLLQKKNIPIVGINSGRLGFLASISKENIDITLSEIFSNNFKIEQRTMIEAVVEKQPEIFGKFNFALNELTVQKKDNSSMINIEVYLNDYFLNNYWADGLIVATPTGSTAYSLSSNGPIIYPDSENFVITPIAPHTLTVRPIVVPDNVKLRIKVSGRGEQFLAALDSRAVSLMYDTEIIIQKANFKTNIVKFNNIDFFKTLRKKLMWGLDMRN
jgi:NAD+ kinase